MKKRITTIFIGIAAVCGMLNVIILMLKSILFRE